MKTFLLLICTLLVISVNAFSAAKTSVTSGLWSDGATWGGTAPVPGDTVTISQGDTVTADGSFDIGTAIAGNIALSINGSFVVPYDMASSTFIFRGIVRIEQGQTPPSSWLIGTASTPYLSTSTLRMYLECASARQFYIYQESAANPGSNQWYGNFQDNEYSTTTYHTTTINDVTTSSNSVKLAGDIQAKVGQEYIIAGTEGQSQAGIYTVQAYDVSTPSITFTSNFNNSYSSGTKIALVSHNIILISSDTTKAGFFQKQPPSAISYSGETTFSHVQFRGLGSTLQGVILAGQYNYISDVSLVENWGMSIYRTTLSSFDDVVIASNSVQTNYGILDEASSGIDFNNIFIILNNNNSGTNNTCLWEKGFGNTWNDCFFSGARNGIRFAQSDITVNDYVNQNLYYNEFQNYDSVVSDCKVILNNGLYRELAKSVSKGTNSPVFSISPTTSFSFSFTFNNCLLAVATDPNITSALMYEGYFSANSILKIQSFQNEVGSNRFYSSGYGLVSKDTTTVRLSGGSSIQCNLGWATYYRSLTPTCIIFDLPCDYGNTIIFRGYARKNTSYGSNTLPYINVYTNNNAVNFTETMSDINDTWELLTNGGTATSTGTVTVYMCVQSTQASAVSWFDDCKLFVGNNVYDLGKIWLGGYPVYSPVANTIDITNFQIPLTEIKTLVSTSTLAIQADIDISSNTIISEIYASSHTLQSISDEIWDEPLTGATHNVSTSAGRRIRELAGAIVFSGTAIGSAGNGNQIQFDTDASSINGAYDPSTIAIVGGTGAGQCRNILEYEGATRIATVDRDWKVLPSSDSEYIIYADAGREHVNEGLVRSATINTVQLNLLSSTTDQSYLNQLIFLRSGTGEDQSRIIIDYDGVTQTATVDSDWRVTPDTTTAYVMLPNKVYTNIEILNAINTSSNTLSIQISTSTVAIQNDIDTSSNTITYEIHQSSGAVWNEKIYNNETASDTIKYMRRRQQ